MDVDDWQEASVTRDEEDEEEDGDEQTQEAGENDASGEEFLNQEYTKGIREMDALGLVDIGNLATWSASSTKQGSEVDQMRSEGPLTFWQSDGPQPHNIDIKFSKRVSIERISIFADFRFDESYTPQKLIICAGTGPHDLQQASIVEIEEPHGWSHINLNEIRPDGILKTFLLRITVAANYQNGKDTHIRAMKLYSPAPSSRIDLHSEIGFTTVDFLKETVIR